MILLLTDIQLDFQVFHKLQKHIFGFVKTAVTPLLMSSVLGWASDMIPEIAAPLIQLQMS